VSTMHSYTIHRTHHTPYSPYTIHCTHHTPYSPYTTHYALGERPCDELQVL
jgi:hypothetical protein